MQGKLIVVEGVDGSGKATQAKLLIEKMEKQAQVTYFDFPRYEESVFGQLLGRCLKGEFGDFLALSPYLSSLPYMLDRAAIKDKMCEALDKGHVVCNRYTTSSLAHQVAKVPPKERMRIIRFLEQAEYKELRIPKPDLVIFLDVSAETASSLVAKKEKRSYIEHGAHDVSESDLDHQLSAADVYRQFADNNPENYLINCADAYEEYASLAAKRTEWRVIQCMGKSGILAPVTIHTKVWHAVSEILQ